MIVMKFGGSSLADGRQIHKALEIVRSRAAGSPVVVCSAHKGVTDLLIDAARSAVRGAPSAEPVITRQKKVLAELGCDLALLDPLLAELSDLLRGISLVREVSPRSLDYVQGFGERMSVRAIADYFTRQGLASQAFDAFDLGFVTDDHFGAARPVKDYERRMKEALAAKVPAGVVPVVTTVAAAA